jgi:hypothetical protein
MSQSSFAASSLKMTDVEKTYFTLSNGAQMPKVGLGTWKVRRLKFPGTRGRIHNTSFSS